ncbi:MAG: aminotransferase class V-fold PLP-dependent enzyme [Myxococcaceae bacterium]
MPSSLATQWTLDPSITFLNHGSFGACPRVVQEAQSKLRARLEAEPVRFMVRELEPLMDDVRRKLGALLGADADDLVFVTNATMGVNTVLKSQRFSAGDELLTTDHAYNACRNALDEVASVHDAKVTVATLPWPVRDEEGLVSAITSAMTPRTKLLLLDHVTSPSAIVLPVERITREANARGIEVLIDGAHAPGMLPLNLTAIGASYYTGNCHKWLCAPKGAAFLWVRRDRQKSLRPLSISHGRNSPRTDRSKFRIEFDWTGTSDPTAPLCISAAIDFLESLGGLSEVMRQNRDLALEGRDILLKALGAEAMVPEALTGSMAVAPLPDATTHQLSNSDPLQDALLFDHQIEVPVMPFPATPKRLLRLSAQRYNDASDYHRLASALGLLLEQ